MKKPYETPYLVEYGQVENITLAGSLSGELDDDYPAGTKSEGGLFS